MAVTEQQDLDEHFDEEFYDDEPSPQPWHNSTPAVLGASAVGVALIAILVGVISLVTGPSGPPADAPLNFVEPSFSETASRTPTSAPTTTATITSTTAVSTTEINAPLAPPPTTSGTSGSSESTSPPSQEEDEDEDEPTVRTPRRTPRTNITRTLIPRPVG
jgi:hypothetical protein